MVRKSVLLSFLLATVGWADTGTQPVNVVTFHGSTVSVNADGGILTHTTNGGSGGTSATYGAAFPAIGTPTGGIGVGGQFQTFAVDASSFLKVNVAAGGTGGGAAQFNSIAGALTTPSYVGVISSFPVNVINLPATYAVIQTSNGVNASTMAVVILGNVTVNSHGVTVSNWVSTASVSVSNWVSTVTASQANSYTVTQGTPTYWVVSVTTVAQSGIWGNQVTNWVSTVAAIPVNSYTVTQGTPTYWVISQSTFTGTLADNGVAAATNRIGTTDGIYQTTYLNGTAATQGRNAAASMGTDGLLWTAALPALRPVDYHASSATQVAASATDIAEVCGNATTTTLITSIRVSCTETTAGIVHLSILKRSTANSNVTAGISTMTVVASDSNYAANSTTATYVYTGNPTRGTLLGQLDSYNIGCMAAGTAAPNDIYISPAWWRTKPIVLRNTRECVTVSLANGIDGIGTTVTGGVFNIAYDFIELTAITP